MLLEFGLLKCFIVFLYLELCIKVSHSSLEFFVLAPVFISIFLAEAFIIFIGMEHVSYTLFPFPLLIWAFVHVVR
jgi:hypothetical protein